MDDKKSVLIISIFIIALALPFSNKAFHIDDTAFLYVAEQIKKEPFKPYSFALEWGLDSGLASHLLDTPLVSYYIALASLIFGKSEVALHLSFLLFHLIAGVSFYFIANKFIKRPLIASLVLVSTPTFLVNSHSLMLDVPMLSLFLLAFALFVYGCDIGSRRLLCLGAIAAGFAYLAKPNAIVLIPLLLAYCFLKNKYVYSAYMLIPVAFIALFSVHNYLFEDRIFIAEHFSFLVGAKSSSFSVLAAYIFSNLSYIGGATIFFAFLIYPFLLKKRSMAIFCVSVLISAASSFALYSISSNFASGRYTLAQILLFFIFVSSALFFIMLVLAENFRNARLALQNIMSRKSGYDAKFFFVFLWFIGVLLLNSFVSGGAVRYNTLFLPPFVISYFILFERYARLGINRQKFLFFALLLTALTGLAVAYADNEYANVYRDFANNFLKKYQNENIWFTGSDGFQYYMGENGYRIYLQDDSLYKKGDIIIRAGIPSPRRISSKLMERLQLTEKVSYDGKIPVRVQNPEAHAGFYTYAAGFLPYSFSNSKLETFEIYRVVN